ncbi:MAG: hypothetical protein HY080_13370 [Gammaproteobacteria bacterium]|nr:hypothetical protein [Gammaproteobacteria bacterium]
MMYSLVRLLETKPVQVVLWPGLRTACVSLSLLASGCASTFIYSNSFHHNSGLTATQLQNEGLAFLTPSTVTGQEEDKQALAFVFSEEFSKMYPTIRHVSLPETLSAINRQGLTDNYRTMYDQYRNTGIFKREILQQIGQATGVRYVAQLKLAGFTQGTEGRFGMLGWRMVDTKYAKLRLFIQIWDTKEGTIVWEVTHEMNYANDTWKEANISFRSIVEESARDVLQRLPTAGNTPIEAVAASP